MAILLAVGVGVVLAYGFYWVIGGFVGTEDEPAAKIDVYKTALAGVAGIGGAVALVVAYRRQRDAEQGRFVERFGAAAAQLGDQDVAVRIAGVYAMAGVADESSDLSRRQQCIDVLCGYLRLPYDPEHGSSHRTEHVTRTTRNARPPITSIEEQVTHRLRQNDREVRQTIVRVICAHLQDNAENSWSRNNLDFTGVLFEETSFEGATFSGEITSFGRATFTGEITSFGEATFSGERTNFRLARFSGERTSFGGATFSGEYTSFRRARFSAEETSFGWATFSGKRTDFDMAMFHGERASFENPHAWNNVTFDWDEKPAHMMPECVQPRDWPPTVVPRRGTRRRDRW